MCKEKLPLELTAIGDKPYDLKDNFIDLPLVPGQEYPIRIVYEENLNQEEIEDLHKQVDLALKGPDFSIITDHYINWEELIAEPIDSSSGLNKVKPNTYS